MYAGADGGHCEDHLLGHALPLDDVRPVDHWLHRSTDQLNTSIAGTLVSSEAPLASENPTDRAVACTMGRH